MALEIGEVIAVRGTKVDLKIYDESSKDTLFYDGGKYKGVSIREYISIQRGLRDIICIVEGEYLDENRYETKNEEVQYIRKVECKPIGYFENGEFSEGIKHLPMIKDCAQLVSEEDISKIFSPQGSNDFQIGKMLKEEIPISLPWSKIFNTHIGIFGNTGSGKSNTLTKLFTVLFQEKKEKIEGKSHFILIDFNGEYTNDQLIDGNLKTVYNLNSRSNQSDKFPLNSDDFWNTETLCILFKATPNTQTPFINRIIKNRDRYSQQPDSLTNYLKSTFKRAFTTTSPKREAIELLKAITKVLEATNLNDKLSRITWRGDQNKYQYPPSTFFDGNESSYNKIFLSEVNAISTNNLDSFEELIVRINLQLINDLLYGYVQFEHIQPLLKRIESSLSSLKNVITITSDSDDNSNILTVLSLRKCNQEIKKILPLLVAKHYYQQHKQGVENPPNNTVHLIIDEAHNILSQQSNREQEAWKDYRLELFEEIIKEGRKFGMFLTLSSQRPADISPTIMSQIHNFFIHRLVNDKDLFLIDNTISTLDSLSKSMIPNLAKGCCIITGSSFDIPITLQVDLLERKYQPDSEDVNLEQLWK